MNTEDNGTETVTTQDEVTTAPDQGSVGQRQFSQEDLDRHIQARLAKETRKFEERLQAATEQHLTQWREERGLTDDALEQMDQRPAVEREVSVYKGKLTSMEKKLAAAQDQAARMRSRLLDTAGRDAVVREALAAGSVDPESVFLHVMASGRLTVDQETFRPVILDEHGDPDPETKISDLVSQTLDARPNLAAPRGSSGSGSRPGTDAAKPDPKVNLGTPGGLRAALRGSLKSVEG